MFGGKFAGADEAGGPSQKKRTTVVFVGAGNCLTDQGGFGHFGGLGLEGGCSL